MVETAGSVVIEIGGNLAPFEAALAKANQLAVSFDAQITAKLSGAGLSAGMEKISAGIEQTNALLAKLTTSGTTAGATMTRLAASTQPVTVALQQVSAATAVTNAELGKIGTTATTAGFSAGAISAKEFAAALEQTGGNLSKITPAMLGIAETESAMTAATLEATAAFRGLTEAQIAAFAAQQEGTNFRNALNESFGLINTTTKSARDSALAFRELSAAETEAGGAARGAAAGMVELGAAEREAAGLGAGVTREFMVLGSEIARGNVSRIPGSLIVLGERLATTGAEVLTLSNGMKALGLLGSTIFNPFVIGFLALSFGAEAAVKLFENIYSGGKKATDVLKEHADALDKILVGYTDAQKAAQGYIDTTTKLPQPAVASDLGAKATSDLKAYQEALVSVKAVGVEFIDGYVKQYEALKDQAPAMAQADALKALQQQFSLINPDLDGLITRLTQIKNDEGAYFMVRNMADAMLKAAINAKTLGDALGSTQTAFASLAGRNSSSDNMLANMVSAGNAAADALKKVQDSLSVTGQTPYAASIANINRQFDDAIIKAHAAGAALDTFNQARNLSVQEESLRALSGITFDTPIAGANQLGIALTTAQMAADHVKVSIGGISAPIVNMTQLLGAAKLDQLMGIETAADKLEEFKLSLTHVSEMLATVKNTSGSFFGAAFEGSQADISGAYSAIDSVFKLFDTGNASVKAVHDRIEEVRATLIGLGADEATVKIFINDIVMGEAKTRQLNSDVQTLGHSIASLPNKTVTITVVTRQVGSGTQSIYDVPNSSGGTSGVGVTRYGGVAGQQSGPSQSAYQVPSTGYGSQGGGSDGSPTGTVTVTRFATGGVIHPGDTQQVSFFKSPDETVAIFTPQQRNALANPQSGFTGTQPTKEEDRYWTVLMNIEAATQKTAQLLDEINTASRNSAISSGSSSGYSSGGNSQGSDQFQQYLQALGAARANYAAIGGGGLVGYGSDALGASPEQIAWNAVYGGMSSVGSPSGGGSIGGGGGYQYLHAGDPANASLNGLTPGTTQYAQAYAQALAKSNAMKGFATGGIDSSDTQKVEFFKNPNEKVIIATPQQFADVRPGTSNSTGSGASDQRPIVINQTHNWNGSTPPSPASQAEIRRQTALGIRDALRSVNGR